MLAPLLAPPLHVGLNALEELIPVPGAIRAPHEGLPTVWRANVEAAREDIAWTLQTLSPNVLELASLWEGFKDKVRRCRLTPPSG